jgi:3-methyladenine DNA glycosylase/8-oxoguanine DNA glycosylase
VARLSCPERLAASSEATLREKIHLGYRIPPWPELQAPWHSGLPTPELHKRLLAIKGVGGSAVAVLRMILGRYDASSADGRALQSVSHEWDNGQPAGRTEVEAAFDRWGVWRGLAY